ncbi:hypothetical protein KW799_00250 [Candidatus Parcubacteria bacterium]|nr:hypothetical protein [Candidatus Parcubacteria bacterium]
MKTFVKICIITIHYMCLVIRGYFAARRSNILEEKDSLLQSELNMYRRGTEINDPKFDLKTLERIEAAVRRSSQKAKSAQEKYKIIEGKLDRLDDRLIKLQPKEAL